MFHNWCNKGCGMCYPVCGMVHIKDPLLLIGNSSPYSGSIRSPLAIWMVFLPYIQCQIDVLSVVLSTLLNKTFPSFFLAMIYCKTIKYTVNIPHKAFKPSIIEITNQTDSTKCSDNWSQIWHPATQTINSEWWKVRQSDRINNLGRKWRNISTGIGCPVDYLHSRRAWEL